MQHASFSIVTTTLSGSADVESGRLQVNELHPFHPQGEAKSFGFRK
jgi:hypothetical protein